MNKAEYAKAIADLLGLEPVPGRGGPWMSTQGTVLEDWVRAVAEALDVPYSTKVTTIRAILEAQGVAWDAHAMASEDTASRGGGNISKPAFRALLEALSHDPRLAQRRPMWKVAPQKFRGPIPEPGEDKRELRALHVRRGQPGFRARLLAAYRERCALTGCDAIAALEAAHILPYSEGGDYTTANGILMRADMHSLFDLRLLAVEPADLTIVVSPTIRYTTIGQELAGRHLAVPRDHDDRPDSQALARHRALCGF